MQFFNINFIDFYKYIYKYIKLGIFKAMCVLGFASIRENGFIERE